jgi:type VI secretion system protein ImpL
LLGPGGLIDAFVNDKLRPFIDMSGKPWRWRSADDIDLGATAESLRPIELAASLRDAWFRDGGSLPSVEFGIRPVAGDSAGSHVVLSLGDQQRLEGSTQPRFQTLRWPAPDGIQQASIGIADTDGRTESKTLDGPWAWFRLLDQATLERGAPDRLLASFRLPGHSARIELRAASVINPFQPDTAGRFECPKGF